MVFLQAAKDAGLHIVTDFVPSTVTDTNNWYLNESMAEFFYPANSRNLDFTNGHLLDKLIVSITFSFLLELVMSISHSSLVFIVVL